MLTDLVFDVRQSLTWVQFAVRKQLKHTGMRFIKQSGTKFPQFILVDKQGNFNVHHHDLHPNMIPAHDIGLTRYAYLHPMLSPVIIASLPSPLQIRHPNVSDDFAAAHWSESYWRNHRASVDLCFNMGIMGMYFGIPHQTNSMISCDRLVDYDEMEGLMRRGNFETIVYYKQLYDFFSPKLND